MTFIHVVHVDVIIEGFEETRTADSQDSFLAKPIIRIPTVEVIGEVSIAWVILRHICVEEVDGDGVTGDSLEIVSPGTDHHRAVFNRHLDEGFLDLQNFFQRPGLVFRALDSMRVEMLLEISFAMQ